jgi:hypothetical protein
MSACVGWAPTLRVFLKFGIGIFIKSLARKSTFVKKEIKNVGHVA